MPFTNYFYKMRKVGGPRMYTFCSYHRKCQHRVWSKKSKSCKRSFWTNPCLQYNFICSTTPQRLESIDFYECWVSLNFCYVDNVDLLHLLSGKNWKLNKCLAQETRRFNLFTTLESPKYSNSPNVLLCDFLAWSESRNLS